MSSENYIHESTLRGWKHGLRNLPAVFLVGIGVFLWLTSIVKEVREVDQRAKIALDASEQAVQDNDLQAAKEANDEADVALERLKQLRLRTFLVVLLSFCVLGVYLRAMWLITEEPMFQTETYARWTIFLIPILLVINIASGGGTLPKLISKLGSVMLTIGQQSAISKICIRTHQLEEGITIDRLNSALFYIFIGCFAAGFLIGVLGLNQQLEPMILPALCIVFGIWLLILAKTIWKIGSGIPLESD